MPKKTQSELFDHEYPEGLFKPIHPEFTGTCTVLKSAYNKDGDHYVVDLDTGECSCEWGQAWVWISNARKWVRNKYCVHKMKALADLVSTQKEAGNDLLWPYIKALASRYNMYEVVSAFHKELRRGDVKRAWFFGCILSTFRGLKGVVKYMHNIVYEETRDHVLASDLEKTLKQEIISVADFCKLLRLFCESPKKWELPGRLDIFKSEMSAYGRLVKEYGEAVAKPSEIISKDEYRHLAESVKVGFKKDDMDVFQFGIKGLQKIKGGGDLQGTRRNILTELKRLKMFKDAEYFFNRITLKAEIGYHDINTLADLMMGEPWAYGKVPIRLRRAIVRNPSIIEFPLGVRINVPLYAHDNHTWAGKSLIKRFPKELDPGQKQEHLDFRWCGAYHGLSWRYQAYDQFASCDVPWESVKLNKGLNLVTQRLFY